MSKEKDTYLIHKDPQTGTVAQVSTTTWERKDLNNVNGMTCVVRPEKPAS